MLSKNLSIQTKSPELWKVLVSPASGAAQTEQPVVRGQHGPVEIDHVRVFMVGQNIVKSNILDNMRVGQDQLDVLGAVHRGAVPEVEKSLFVLMNWYARLRQFWMEQLPQVLEVWTKEELLVLGEQ